MEVLKEIDDTDAAFLSAVQPKSLDGIELKPFSLMRQTIVNELTIHGRTVFFDAVHTIWICTLEPEDAIKVLADKAKATIQAFEWVEQHGISVQNSKPLIDIYKRLNAEIAQATNVVTEDDGDEPPKNVGGPPAS